MIERPRESRMRTLLNARANALLVSGAGSKDPNEVLDPAKKRSARVPSPVMRVRHPMRSDLRSLILCCSWRLKKATLYCGPSPGRQAKVLKV
jgi:hypothetical protein